MASISHLQSNKEQSSLLSLGEMSLCRVKLVLVKQVSSRLLHSK